MRHLDRGLRGFWPDVEAVICPGARGRAHFVWNYEAPHLSKPFEVRDRRKRLASIRPPQLRLRRGELVADIVLDRRSRQPLWFCIVQRDCSPEVLYMAQFCSQDEARMAAEQCLSELDRQTGTAPAA